MQGSNGVLVLTIGHSNRTIDNFLAVLEANKVTVVVDIRTIPSSRHCTQFNENILADSLNTAGKRHIHMVGLGGLRHPLANSLNGGWNNASFRGFADYMQTAEFDQSLQHLMNITKREQVILMCAEKLPWRCHRSLVSDALLVRGFKIEHIIDANTRYVHHITPFASISETTITYPSVIEGKISSARTHTVIKRKYNSGRKSQAA
jgi:uncharacterized protein (DUF488 family)